MPIIRIRFRKMNPSSSPGLRAIRLTPPLPPPISPSTDSESISSLDEPMPVSELLSTLTKDLETVAAASTIMRKQVRSLYSRASRELVDWMHTPLTPIPALAVWLEAKGNPPQPTLQEFLDTCFKAATTLNLSERTLTFRKEDAAALGFSEQIITVFDLFAALPKLFL